MKKTIAVLGLLIFLLPGAGYATPIYVDGIGGTPVGSSEMNGMKITVGFTDESEEIQFWNDGASVPDNSGTLWSLDFLGANTSDLKNDWMFTATAPIDWFRIDAFPGNVVFDIIFSNLEVNGGTDGSDSGFWAPNFDSSDTADETTGTSGPNITNAGKFTDARNYGAEFGWSFSNPVYLKGASESLPSDLFSTLFIDFTADGGFTGTEDSAFYFGVDTDLVVPEPSTLLLFGVGLLGLGALGRRRR